MIGSTKIQLGGIATAWVTLAAIASPYVPINLGYPLHATIGALLAAITIIWAIRGSVLMAALKAGRAVEQEAARRKAVRAGPQRVA